MLSSRVFCILATAITILLSACSESPATFAVESDAYPANTVLKITDTDDNILKTVNLTPQLKEIVIRYPEERFATISVTGPAIYMSQPMYLEGARYVVKIDSANASPLIIASTSARQKELMDYYNTRYLAAKELGDSVSKYNEKFVKEYPDNYANNHRNLLKFAQKLDALDLAALYALAKKYPGSLAVPFIIHERGNIIALNTHYSKIMQQMTNDVKESRYGKKVLKELALNLGTKRGAIMPDIEGTDLAGHRFDKAMLKKVNVIICWMSLNNIVRRKHKEWIGLYNKYKSQDVAFIGISYDKNMERLKGVVALDGLPWPQFTDLKGANSPNIRLNSAAVPYIFIVGKDKKILRTHIPPTGLEGEIKAALLEAK